MTDDGEELAAIAQAIGVSVEQVRELVAGIREAHRQFDLASFSVRECNEGLRRFAELCRPPAPKWRPPEFKH